MPVILPYGQESRWLKPNLSLAEILKMLAPYPSKQLNGYQVSNKIDHPGSYSKGILTPYGEILSSLEQPLSLLRSSYCGHKKRHEGNIRKIGG